MDYRVVFSLFGALMLSACDETYNDQLTAFVEYVEEHRLGSNANYWLEEQILTGEWAKVVFVFGYPRNGEVCGQFIEQDKKVGTVGEFRCARAN